MVNPKKSGVPKALSSVRNPSGSAGQGYSLAPRPPFVLGARDAGAPATRAARSAAKLV